MNLITELKKHKTVFILLSDDGENEIKIIKTVINLSRNRVGLVTFHQKFDSLKKKLSQKDLRSLVVVDAVSKLTQDKPDQTEGCYFVNSPKKLKQISSVIERFIRHGFEFIVLDSITILPSYVKKDRAEQFFREIIRKVKPSKTKLVLLALDDPNTEFIQHIAKAVDKAIMVPHP